MCVVVNADDYGHDENRTRAIQRAFRIGAITSTTAMANRPWFERAMKEAREFGFVQDVGLHFNVTEGAPLTAEARNCPELCNDRGEFECRFYRSVSARFCLPSSARSAIRAEAQAQMQKYLDCGGRLLHLDSHHHIHTFFSVAREIYPVAKKLGFRSARLSRNIDSRMSFSTGVYKKLWNLYSRLVLPSRTEYFGSFKDFESCWRRLPQNASVEVMVHPLYGEYPRMNMAGEFSDHDAPMAHEIEFWKEVRNHGVRICNYMELVNK